MINPFHLTETQAAYYARLKVSLLRSLSIPYLQYADDEPRYYRKEDLDKVIQSHIKNHHPQKKPKPDG